MENQSDGVEAGEQISCSFICCVCLDLLYKPIVLGCGHVSCFWCVHRTMSGLHESKCPICRHPYGHFPTICQVLHFLLLKMYPVAYKTRETYILEEEKEMGCFSPKVDDLLLSSNTKEESNHLDDQAQFFTYGDRENLSTNPSTRKEETCAKKEQPAFVQDTIPKQTVAKSFEATCTVVDKGYRLPQRSCNKICASRTNKELNHLGDRAQSFTFCDGDKLSSNLSSNKKEEACAKVEQQELFECVQDNSTTMPKQITSESFESTCTVGVKENKSPQRSHNGSSGQVSIGDVSCATCKQLLFRPAVLNCGHVYCEACIMLVGEAIRCQVCQSPHPSGFPKVCLEFDHFLAEQFPEEYTARRGTVQLKQVQFQHENSLTCSTKEGGFFHWLGEHGPDVHIGAGCDSCGMYPIKGDRYRCIDCKEAIGFDLCGDCYNTRSKLPGRFNQQHTPDHRFEKEKSKTLRNIMLRLLRGESVDGLLAPLLSVDALENPENELPLVAPSTASDSEEPDDTQPAS